MKKKNILSAAARLFAERGFNNTPTILLAQEAGVAEGTIFRHFKTKDDIFFVLIDNVHEQMLADLHDMVQARASANGLETALALIREFCIFVRRNPMEFGLLFRDTSSRYGDTRDRAYLSIRSLYEEVGQLMLDAITKGQADGSVDSALDPEDTSALLVCQMIGLSRGLYFNLILQERGESRLLAHCVENTTKMLRPVA